MAEQNPPAFLQTSSSGTTAEDLRRYFTALSAGSSGVFGTNELKVTESDTPAMSVKVASGRALIAGSESAYQGTYFVENRGDETLTVSPSDPTNTRIDIVVAEVRDSAYSGANNDWQLRVVTGTPSGTPSAPATPDNALLLATINVAPGSVAVTDATIADNRDYAYTHGAIASVPTLADLPTSPPEGHRGYVQATDVEYVYNGSVWLPVGHVRSATASTPVTVASTSYASVTSAVITLPAGRWLIQAKGACVQTGTTAQYDVRIYNSTDGTELDVISVFHTAAHRAPWALKGVLSNTSDKAVRLEHRVVTVHATQSTDNAKIWAVPMSVLI